METLANATSFLNNSDSSEEEEEEEVPQEVVVKPIRRKSMMLPPSRLSSFESTTNEESATISGDKTICKLESFVEEPQAEVLVNITVEKLLEVMKTFPLPPSTIEITSILPPPASVVEPSQKIVLKGVVSGGLSAMKSWWGNRRASKGGSAT